MDFQPSSDLAKAAWLPAYYRFSQQQEHTVAADNITPRSQAGVNASRLADGTRGALLGLALGDAVGMPLEFQPRDARTVIDMEAGGPFNLEAGDWTDDTSMACCLAESLIACRGFDARHQMETYCRWHKEGAYTRRGVCFDIGGATRQALERFFADGNPYAGSEHPRSAGNGSLMRLAPVPLFFAGDFHQAVHHAGESSKTTHRAAEAIDACRYFGGLIQGALHGVDKRALLDGAYSPTPGYWDAHPLVPAIAQVDEGSYKHKHRDQISSSGYVVHTLEAALWAFHRNDDFRSGLLEAVNLADDSDTVGAVYGQIAGAYHGESGLSLDWRDRLFAAQDSYRFAENMLAMQRNRTSAP